MHAINFSSNRRSKSDRLDRHENMFFFYPIAARADHFWVYSFNLFHVTLHLHAK